MLEPVLAAILSLYVAALALAGVLEWRRSGLALPVALRRFFTVPDYGDEEDVRRIHLLLPLLNRGMLVALLFAVFLAWQWGARDWPLAIMAAWLPATYLGLFVLVRRGHVRVATRLLPFAAYVIITLILILARGFHGAAVSAYCVVVVAAALLQNGRAAVLYALLTMGMLSGLYWLETAHLVDLSGTTSTVQVLGIYLGTFATVALLLSQGARALADARRHTRHLQGLQAEQSRQLDQALQIERKRARQLELLNEFARTLTGLNDPPALMRAATERLGEAFGFDAAALYLVEEESFRLSAVAGLFAAVRAPGAILTPGVGAAGWVAEHGETCWIDQPEADARFRPEPGLALACVVAVPLQLGKSLVGVFEIGSSRAGLVDASDVRAVESLADLIVAGLQSSQLFIQLRQRQQLTEALRRVGAAVNASLDLNTVLDTICAESQVAFAADRVEVWLEDWPVPLRRVARCGVPSVGDTGPLSAAAAFIDAALRTGRHLFTSAATPAETPAPSAYFAGAQSLLVAPLSQESRAFGALLIVESHRPRRFTAEDAAAAQLLGAQLAAAVDNARLYAAHRRRADELALLNDITRAALEISDVPHLTETLAERMGELIGAEGCFLTLWDAVHQVVEPTTASSNLRAAYLALRSTEPGQISLSLAVLDAGRALAVPDVYASPYFHLEPGALAIRAVLGVPLIAGGEQLGAALLVFNAPHPFTPDEVATAEQAGRQLALALARAKALETERRRNAQLEALRQASLQLTSSLEPRQVLDAMLEQVLRLASAHEAQIYLFDGAQLTFGAARSALGEPAGVHGPPLPNPLTEIVAHSGERSVVPDVQAHPAWPADSAGALVSLPLCKGAVVRGVMNVIFDGPRLFDAHDLRLLDLLGDQAAIALENARLYEAERQRAVQLSLLSDVSQRVADTLDEALLLQRTTDAMVNGLGFAEAAILVPAGEDDLRVVALSKTQPMVVEIGFVQKVGAGVIGRAAATRTTYVTNDVGHDEYYFDPGGRGRGSAIGLPLIREGDLLGVLYIETSTPNAFSPLDVIGFETLARHVATGLQNARLFAGARQRLQYLTALQSVSNEIAASLDLDRIMGNVVHQLNTTFGYRYISIYVLDQTVLCLKAQVGYPEDLIIRQVPIERGVMGRTVRTRQTQFVPEVAADPDFLRASYAVRSEICVPLLTESAVLGALNVESDLEQTLTAADVSLLTTLAAQVTVAMVNAQLFEAERDQRELTETLRAASLAMSSSLDFDQLLDELLLQAAKIVPYDAGCVIVVEAGWTRHARQRGFDQFGEAVDAGTQDIRLEVASTPNLAQVINSGQPLLIPDTALYPGWKPVPGSAYLRSWAGVPIIAQGETMALFSLESRTVGFFTPEHARRLATLAGQVALALQNARLFAAQHRRSEDQRLLLAAARDLSAGLSQAAVLAAAARHMTEGLHNDGCTIYGLDRATNRLVTLLDYARNGTDPVDRVGNTHALADFPITSRVLETRQPAVLDVHDAAADPAEVAVMRAYGIGHLIMLPLFNGDDVFGLIEVHRNVGRPAFADTDLPLTQSLAAQAAVAFDNALLHTTLQENLRELNALLKANEALLSTLELEPLLQNILDAAIEAIPSAQMGTVLLLDEGQTQLQIRAAQGYDDPRILGLTFGREQGFSGRALRENRSLLINNSYDEIEVPWEPSVPEARTIHSAIVAPLAPKGGSQAPYGVLSIEAKNVQAFTADDLRVLVAFANAAAVAIDNARLHAEVQRLAVTDSLTDLANPRAFELALLTEFHRASRYGYALSLVIMDIDSFKVYNDAYGHPAGNERLKGIADILRANVRDPDLPVRYGGEEFALLLPHTSKDGALALAERIRLAAETAAPEAARGGPVSGYSLSLGVASFPSDARTSDELLVAADNAELLAKRGGKNQVVAAPVLTEPRSA